ERHIFLHPARRILTIQGANTNIPMNVEAAEAPELGAWRLPRKNPENLPVNCKTKIHSFTLAHENYHRLMFHPPPYAVRTNRRESRTAACKHSDSVWTRWWSN